MNKTIITEWQNEHKGMEWQKITQVRIIDENNIIIDGYVTFTDTRINQ